MNPLLAEALGSIVRAGLMVLAGYIVKAGIWSSSDAETYVAAGSLALVGLGWSIWQKYKNRLKLLTALTTPPGISEATLEEQMKAGFTLAVSATTPKTEKP